MSCPVAVNSERADNGGHTSIERRLPVFMRLTSAAQISELAVLVVAATNLFQLFWHVKVGGAITWVAELANLGYLVVTS